MNRHIYIHIHRTRTYDAFVETEHPRGRSGSNAGQFVKKGTGSTGTASSTKTPQTSTKTSGHLPGSTTRSATTTTQRKTSQQAEEPRRSQQTSSEAPSGHLPGGKRRETLIPMPTDRSEWPEHIRKLRIPPAWTNLQYNPDPNGEKLVTGRDAKGRLQPLYSSKHSDTSKAEKFKRIKKLATKFDAFQKKNNKNLNARDQNTRQHAEALGLVMETGIRPGSERETGGEVQAYGITNMQGQHVISEGNKTYLRFVGKKGVHQNLEIDNKELANALRERAKKAGPNGKVFPDVDDNSLRRYSKDLTGGIANPKDFRTLLATSMAHGIVNSMPIPTSKSALKKAIKDIATTVSHKLGNTPAIALNSYISPYVWSNWKLA